MAEEPEPIFEDALTRVERIVEDLERGEPSLSTALAKYEDGVKLLRRCYDLLDQAERSVALLTGVDEHGQPTTAPFDATATPAHEPQAVAPAPAAGDTGTRRRERKSSPRPAAAGRDVAEISDPPF
jgi:exodeoxyribonuclease VII small subunit